MKIVLRSECEYGYGLKTFPDGLLFALKESITQHMKAFGLKNILVSVEENNGE